MILPAQPPHVRAVVSPGIQSKSPDNVAHTKPLFLMTKSIFKTRFCRSLIRGLFFALLPHRVVTIHGGAFGKTVAIGQAIVGIALIDEQNIAGGVHFVRHPAIRIIIPSHATY
jgi:hypothetical protein